MVLRRWHERLHNVDVALAAVGLQLCLKAVVAEPFDPYRRWPHPQAAADRPRQSAMSATTEYHDFAHDHLTPEVRS